jgi:hypothetical protein
MRIRKTRYDFGANKVTRHAKFSRPTALSIFIATIPIAFTITQSPDCPRRPPQLPQAYQRAVNPINQQLVSSSSLALGKETSTFFFHLRVMKKS